MHQCRTRHNKRAQIDLRLIDTNIARFISKHGININNGSIEELTIARRIDNAE
jgi:hypothetical protein